LNDLFKGRETFLVQLKASLIRTEAGHATAIVQSAAVHGLGGVGKTRLAVEYGWRHAAEYSALLFVTADSPENLRRNLAALAAPAVLSLPEHDLPSEEVREAAALRWLEAHPGWFLILDNVDAPEAAEAVEKILARLRHGHVLITARRLTCCGWCLAHSRAPSVFNANGVASHSPRLRGTSCLGLRFRSHLNSEGVAAHHLVETRLSFAGMMQPFQG
jgi:hypothetical protein